MFDTSKLHSRHVAGGQVRVSHRQNLENVNLDANQNVVFAALKAISVGDGKVPSNLHRSGVVRDTADQVGSARDSAMIHAGGKAQVVCCADI
jgi:hypothetical protein